VDKVAVIDYGMGNLHSVGKALEKVSTKTKVIVTSDKKKINNSKRIVIPGVGAIKDCINSLKSEELLEVILENVKKKPTLAICVGMQILLEKSEENNGITGLGVLNGEVKRIPNRSDIKVPHMGWNQVEQIKDHELWKDIDNKSYFYFVHSYSCFSSDSAIAKTEHGEKFVSAIADQNVFAVQFHPEKSQKNGLTFYRNFLNWKGEV